MSAQSRGIAHAALVSIFLFAGTQSAPAQSAPVPNPASQGGSGGDSGDDIHWVLALTIKEGREGDLEPLMNEMVDATRGEEGALAYEWLRNESSVHLYERYEDSEAALVHMEGFGENFAERFLDVFEVERFDVYGPASDEVRAAAADLEPAHFDLIGGFAR